MTELLDRFKTDLEGDIGCVRTRLTARGLDETGLRH
jgi:hypothetical protein